MCVGRLQLSPIQGEGGGGREPRSDERHNGDGWKRDREKEEEEL